MKLKDFFNPNEVYRDAEFSVTLHPRATCPGAICYAMSEALILKVNRNPYLTAVITRPEFVSLLADAKGVAVVENPQQSYYELHNHLFRSGSMRVHREHSISPSAQIAPTASIGNHVVIEDGVTIGPGAIIGDFTILGEGTAVEAYAVIGARGMQNTKVNDRRFKVEWAGGVKIGKNCEVLTAAIVQRPYHCEYTEIGDDSQISVKVNIGHGVRVGARTMIGGNAQVAGNATIGSDVWIGQSSTISDGISIGDGAEVKMGSVVVRSVSAGTSVSGNFAFRHDRHIQEYVAKLHE